MLQVRGDALILGVNTLPVVHNRSFLIGRPVTSLGQHGALLSHNLTSLDVTLEKIFSHKRVRSTHVLSTCSYFTTLYCLCAVI